MNAKPRSTNDVLESPRGRVAYKECTCDPIFLFQVRRVNLSESDFTEMEISGWKCDEGWVDEEGVEVYGEEFAERGYGTITWETIKVFAHREEARRYGERRPYAWGDEGQGWRVYCVEAVGHLKQLLLAAGDKPPDQPAPQTLSGVHILRPSVPNHEGEGG